MNHKTAIVLGASGSVGQALVEAIVRSGQFRRVVIFTRRPLHLKLRATVEERLLPDMDAPSLARSVVDVLVGDGAEAVGFSVLGVGADTARLTLEEHRAIDVGLNAAFAKGLKESGKVRHLAYMSAVGADATARTTGSGAPGMGRYSRVKGEAEAAVRENGPAVVSIFRPSVIVDSQHTPRPLAIAFAGLSPLMPGKFRPVRKSEIAQAMVAVALATPNSSRIYSFPEMKQLIAAVPY